MKEFRHQAIIRSMGILGLIDNNEIINKELPLFLIRIVADKVHAKGEYLCFYHLFRCDSISEVQVIMYMNKNKKYKDSTIHRYANNAANKLYRLLAKNPDVKVRIEEWKKNLNIS